jgi:hypothetical protein
MRGQTTHEYYANNKGQCDHAIRVPGSRYEIGLVRNPNGSYKLAYDFFGDNGKRLKEAIGEKEEKFMAGYTKHFVTRFARSKGYMVQQKRMSNGDLRVQLTGRL